VSNFVGIDNRRAEFGQDFRGGAFAGTDSSGHTDGQRLHFKRTSQTPKLGSQALCVLVAKQAVAGKRPALGARLEIHRPAVTVVFSNARVA
jgi:hypothetical protein